MDEFQRNCYSKGTALILAGIRRLALQALQQAPTWDRLDPKNVVKNIDSALDRAREILGLPGDPAPLQNTRRRKRRAA